MNVCRYILGGLDDRKTISFFAVSVTLNLNQQNRLTINTTKLVAYFVFYGVAVSFED